MQVISKRSRAMRALLVTTLALAAGVVALPVAAPASAAGAIAFDDFSGTVRGTRSYDVAGNSTFTQSGGTGNIKLEKLAGNGSIPTVTLTYAMGPTNLKDTTNGQLFLDLLDIQGGSGLIAVSISAIVTDSSGRSSSYSSGIGATPSHGFVLNYDCSPGQTTCFTGTADLKDITTLQVMFTHGDGNATAPAVTLRVAGITSTPLGGARPAVPTPVITTATPAVVGADGGETSFDVVFRSGASEASLVGLSASVVSVAGGTGTTTTTVTGPSTIRVTTRLGAGTGTQDLTVTVPAGAVTDTWGQQNAQASLTHRVRFAAAPSWSGPTQRTVLAGSALTGAVATWPQAQGEAGVTHSIASGALPAGTYLLPTGLLGGAATTPGSFQFTVSAVDGFGVQRSRIFTLVVVPETAVSPVNVATWVGLTTYVTLNTTGLGPGSSAELVPAVPGVTVTISDQSVRLAVSGELGTHTSELVISTVVGSDTVVTERSPVSIEVKPMPSVTVTPPSALRAGRLADVVIASASDASSVDVAGAVPGMTVSQVLGSVSLVGTPTAAGVFDIVVTARDSIATSSKTVRVEVVAPRATTVVTPSGGAVQTVVEGGTVSFDVVQDAEGERPTVGADVLTAGDVVTSGVGVASVAVAATSDGYRVDVTLASGAVDGDLVVTLPDGATVDSWGAASLAGSGTVRLTIQHAPVPETVKPAASITGAGTPADPFRVPAGGPVSLTLAFGGTPAPTLTLESVTSVAAGFAGGGAAVSGADLVASLSAVAPQAVTGLALVDHGDGTGTVSGQLAAGTYDVAVRASNAVASVVRTVRVHVAAQPVVVPTPTVPPTEEPTPTPTPTDEPVDEPTSTPTDDTLEDPSDDVVPDGDADGDSDGDSDGASDDDESLPVTGGAVGGLATLSLLLVAGGALLLVWRRKVA